MIKVGDYVRINDKKEKTEKSRGYNIYMEKYIGQVGKIVGGVSYSYKVRFSDGQWWWYDKESLDELEEHEQVLYALGD